MIWRRWSSSVRLCFLLLLICCSWMYLLLTGEGWGGNRADIWHAIFWKRWHSVSVPPRKSLSPSVGPILLQMFTSGGVWLFPVLRNAWGSWTHFRNTVYFLLSYNDVLNRSWNVNGEHQGGICVSVVLHSLRQKNSKSERRQQGIQGEYWNRQKSRMHLLLSSFLCSFQAKHRSNNQCQ